MAIAREDILELSTDELIAKIAMEEKAYRKMKFDFGINPPENTNVIRESRRDIARLKTELREREIKAAAESKAEENA